MGAGVGEEDEGHGCGGGSVGLGWKVRRGLVRRGMAQGVCALKRERVIGR